MVTGPGGRFENVKAPLPSLRTVARPLPINITRARATGPPVIPSTTRPLIDPVPVRGGGTRSRVTICRLPLGTAVWAVGVANNVSTNRNASEAGHPMRLVGIERLRSKNGRRQLDTELVVAV